MLMLASDLRDSSHSFLERKLAPGWETFQQYAFGSFDHLKPLAGPHVQPLPGCLRDHHLTFGRKSRVCVHGSKIRLTWPVSMNQTGHSSFRIANSTVSRTCPVQVMRSARSTPSRTAPSFFIAACERALRRSTRNSTRRDRKSTRLNSSHSQISYAV